MIFGLFLGMQPGDPRLGMIAAVMLAAQFSISALNEWADADADAGALRRRPIPLGLISRPSALIAALALGGLAIAACLAAGRGWISLLLLAIGLGCGWLYDLLLKRTIFSFVPFAIAFPLLYVWVGVLADRPAGALLPFFLVGAPLGIAIHLADSLPDLESDARSGLRGLATTLGRRRAVLATQAALLLSSLLVATSFVHQPPVAILLLTVGVIGAVLAEKTVNRNAGMARWSVTATALALALPWLAVRA